MAGYKWDEALKELMQFPQFLQGYGMMQALGKDMSPYMLSGKEGKKAKTADPSGWFKLSKGQWMNIGQFMQDMPSIAKDFMAKQSQSVADSQAQLAQTPGWSTVYQESKGNFDPQTTAAIDQAFGQMGSFSFGGQGVNSGQLHDSVQQAALLGPLALNKVQWLKQMQQTAQDKVMAASGAYGMSPIGASYTPGSAMSYMPALQQSLGMFQQGGQFADQLALQQKTQTYDFYGDIAGAGAGAYGSWLAS